MLTGISVLALCLSVSAWLLHWRVENEPGASPVPDLLDAHLLLLAAGAVGTMVFPGLVFLYRAKPYLHLLIPLAAAMLLYAPLFVLTLVMLV